MRKINILTEDYIQLENFFGDIEDNLRNQFYNTRKTIDEALNPYSQKNDTAEYLKLKYSPIFETLSTFNYRENIGALAKEISKKSSMQLSEATKLSYLLREEESIENSISDAVFCFGGVTESNIPEVSNMDYYVEYTAAGKKKALGFLTKMQESVNVALENLKSHDPAILRENLYILGNIYTFLKGE